MNGEIPSDKYQHNPTLKNKDGYTVALLLAEKGIIPPK